MNKTHIIFGTAMAAIVMTCPCQAATKQDLALQALNNYLQILQTANNLAMQALNSPMPTMSYARLDRLQRNIDDIATFVRDNQIAVELSEVYMHNENLIMQHRQQRTQLSSALAISNQTAFCMSWIGFNGKCIFFESELETIYGRFGH